MPGKIVKDHFVPLQCQRFVRDNNISAPEWGDICKKEMFTSDTEKCSQWIFDESERTIVNDVNLYMNSNV